MRKRPEHTVCVVRKSFRHEMVNDVPGLWILPRGGHILTPCCVSAVARRLLTRHLCITERPERSEGVVAAKADAVRVPFRESYDRRPLRAEPFLPRRIMDGVILPAVQRIHPCDLHAAEAVFLEPIEIRPNVFLRDNGCKPPPAREWF